MRDATLTASTLMVRQWLRAKADRQAAEASLKSEVALRAKVAPRDSSDPLDLACIEFIRARSEELRLQRLVDGIAPRSRP